MTFRPKVPKESAMERFERQAAAQHAFYQHLKDRTQAAQDLIAQERKPQQEKP